MPTLSTTARTGPPAITAGTGGCGLQEHAACAEFADDFMRDRGAAQRNLHQVLLCVLDALADRVRNFAGLADAEADNAVAVADDDERCELKDTAAFNGLGNAVDGNYALLQIEVDASIFIAKTIFLLA